MQMAELQESNQQAAQQLQDILDSLPDGILTLDESGRIIGINRAACKMLGVSRKKALLKGCTCVLGKKLCGPNSALLNSIRDKKKVTDYETQVVDSNGQRRVLLLSGTVLRNTEGEDSGAVITVQDITEITELRQDLEKRYSLYNIIGKSKQMREIFDLIEEVSDSNATVLIEGETGTGKELVARAVHHHHIARAKKPFVAINCSALAEGLLESELFGHVRGAFTGATRDKRGRFEAANGGTIFLDEIGDISPLIQVKLLRVLQERTIERVGSDKTISVDVRVVAATHRSLSELVNQGKFRQDLFYRLRVVPIRIPPLRERRDDIPLLAQYFIDRFRDETGRPVDNLEQDSLEYLVDYDWPGNVRELENAIEYAFVKCRRGAIKPGHLPTEIISGQPSNSNQAVKPRLHSPELGKDDLLTQTDGALRTSGWNIAKAARQLGISRTTLYKRIKEFDLVSPFNQ